MMGCVCVRERFVSSGLAACIVVKRGMVIGICVPFLRKENSDKRRDQAVARGSDLERVSSECNAKTQ